MILQSLYVTAGSSTVISCKWGKLLGDRSPATLEPVGTPLPSLLPSLSIPGFPLAQPDLHPSSAVRSPPPVGSLPPFTFYSLSRCLDSSVLPRRRRVEERRAFDPGEWLPWRWSPATAPRCGSGCATPSPGWT